MNDCTSCHAPVTVAETLCPECREWAVYWATLTPEQRQAERDMMDLHDRLTERE